MSYFSWRHGLMMIGMVSATASGGCGLDTAEPSSPGVLPVDNPTGHRVTGPISPDSAPSGAFLTFHGGAVIPNVNIYQVLYGGTGTYIPELTGSAAVNMSDFYTQLTTSGTLDWLSQFSTLGVASVQAPYTPSPGTQTIGRGQYAGTITIAPSHTSSSLSNGDVQSELVAQINAGHLPQPSLNNLYMIHFPRGTSITDQNGERTCSAVCGFHGAAVVGTKLAYYAVLPDVGGSGCNCNFGLTTFQNQTYIASHELIEAITDSAIDTSYEGWYDDNTNGEIADDCEGQSPPYGSFTGTDGRTYMLALAFSDRVHNCVAH